MSQTEQIFGDEIEPVKLNKREVTTQYHGKELLIEVKDENICPVSKYRVETTATQQQFAQVILDFISIIEQQEGGGALKNYGMLVNIFDMENLKVFNDMLGHTEAGNLLRQNAQFIRRNTTDVINQHEDTFVKMSRPKAGGTTYIHQVIGSIEDLQEISSQLEKIETGSAARFIYTDNTGNEHQVDNTMGNALITLETLKTLLDVNNADESTNFQACSYVLSQVHQLADTMIEEKKADALWAELDRELAQFDVSESISEQVKARMAKHLGIKRLGPLGLEYVLTEFSKRVWAVMNKAQQLHAVRKSPSQFSDHFRFTEATASAVADGKKAATGLDVASINSTLVVEGNEIICSDELTNVCRVSGIHYEVAGSRMPLFEQLFEKAAERNKPLAIITFDLDLKNLRQIDKEHKKSIVNDGIRLFCTESEERVREDADTDDQIELFFVDRPTETGDELKVKVACDPESVQEIQDRICTLLRQEVTHPDIKIPLSAEVQAAHTVLDLGQIEEELQTEGTEVNRELLITAIASKVQAIELEAEELLDQDKARVLEEELIKLDQILADEMQLEGADLRLKEHRDVLMHRLIDVVVRVWGYRRPKPVGLFYILNVVERYLESFAQQAQVQEGMLVAGH